MPSKLKKSPDRPKLFDSACLLVSITETVSAPSLQRQMNLNYAQAAEIIEVFESLGFIESTDDNNYVVFPDKIRAYMKQEFMAHRDKFSQCCGSFCDHHLGLIEDILYQNKVLLERIVKIEKNFDPKDLV